MGLLLRVTRGRVSHHPIADPELERVHGGYGHSYLNTLLLQRVLDDPAWADRLGPDDRRGLTPLFWSNINPYGRFLPGHGPAARPRGRTNDTCLDELTFSARSYLRRPA